MNFKRTDWLLFILVMLVAVLFRFYHLNSSPAGIVHDAAINGADAWRLLNRGGHTPFLEGNGGRESLFIYLQSGAIALFGTTTLAIRLPGVLIDTLTVALVFLFTYWLLNSRWAALYAGLAAGVSYWLLTVSRLGLRAVLVPFLSILLFWAFLAGWRKGNWKFFALAGLFLGLSGYSYSAARVLPLIIALAALPGLLRPGENKALWKKRWAGVAVTALSALLLQLPMLLYVLKYPQQLTNRPLSVAIWHFAETPSDLRRVLWENTWSNVLYFCCKGSEISLTFGLPGRPVQDIGLGLLLLLGLGLAIARSKFIELRLLWLWFIIGLLPGLLAIEAPHPLRLIASAVPSLILLALGMDFLAKKIKIVWRHKPVYPLPFFFVAWLFLGGFFTFRDYYFRWPALAETAVHFNDNLAALAQNFQQRAEEGEVIYIPQSLYRQPVLRYFLLGDFAPRATKTFTETGSNITWWETPGTGPMVRLSKGEALILPSMTAGEFGTLVAVGLDIASLQLESVAYPAVISPTNALSVTLYWQPKEHPAADYKIVLQLLDDRARVWSLNNPAEGVGGAYPVGYWQPGDAIAETHHLRLKDDLPFGRYRLAVALYDPRQDQRLPILNPPSAQVKDTVFVGVLKVPLPQFSRDNFTVDTFHFEEVVDLLGYRLNSPILSSEENLQLDLLWQAVANIETDFTIFVHLLDEDGNLLIGYDSQPLNGQYPTSIWDKGEYVVDSVTLDTVHLPPGNYWLEVGLYNAITGERVPVTGDAQNRALLNVQLTGNK